MNSRILLADDHRIVRDGLRSLLESMAEVELVAQAEDGRTAVRLAAELAPDIVIMDINMPLLNGIEATRQITTNAGHRPKVIALSGFFDSRSANEMLRAGATGLVSKASAFEELAFAIHALAADRIYISPTVTGMVVEDLTRIPTTIYASASSTLSPREREVLQLVAEGLATKEIAQQLHVSVKTVETHRRGIMKKLGLDSIAKLTKFALREGVTSLEF